LPWTSKIVDDIALIKSVWTEAINHDPAVTYICTGNQLPGRPSLGSWLSYGLGSMNDNLPAFVVMVPTWSSKANAQALYNRLWGAGFLPSKHQGVSLRSQGDPVLYLNNPPGVDAATRRRMLDSLSRLNQHEFDSLADPETQARIAQYEMAFRMQTSIPELKNIASEPKHILEMYGPDVEKPGTFANCALMARRLAERGVRFVQIFHGSNGGAGAWDAHGGLKAGHTKLAAEVDKPTAGLLRDLKQRGLLEDTIVCWGSEFGRTPGAQGSDGRDHHPYGFTAWLAGGGVKGGVVHGATDPLGFHAVENRHYVTDIHATVLHQLGLDPRKLEIPGRKRLEIDYGKPIREILA
jgi:hypothetical protein